MIEGFEEVLKKLDNLPYEERKIEIGTLRIEILKRQREIENIEREKNNTLNPNTAEYIEKLKNDLNTILEGNSNNQMLDYKYSEGYISVLDYYKYLSNLYLKLYKKMDEYENKLSKACDGEYSFSICNYNLENSTLSIEADEVDIFGSYDIINFDIKLSDGELYLTKSSDDYDAKRIIVKIHSIVKEMFDEINNWSTYLEDYKNHKIQIVGSNLEAHFDIDTYDYEYNFYLFDLYIHELLLRIDGKDYDICSDYCSIIEILDKHEEELLSKTYLRISDLPIAYQEDVKSLRTKQIEKLNSQDKTVEVSNIPLVENTDTKISLWQKVLGRRGV